MFNRISFFAIVIITLIFFASCNKEAIVLPTNQTETIVGERSTTVEIEVHEVNHSEVSGELLVNFSAAYDFTGVVLEPTQYLNFEDTSGNSSTLTFQTTSFTGANGSLQAAFTIGGNDLTGLSLTEMQEIIIEDDSFE